MRLIDADALTEKYGDWYTEEGTEEGYIGTIKGIVESMPTIEERKTGMWRRAQYGYTCNQCGKTHLLRTAYCPTCGAEMDC